MEVSSKYAVQMHGITKTFGTFCALDHVDLDVKRGTIHSLLGENGAGKSTLMNVLYGLYQADEGEIYLNGEKVNIANPNVAIAHGIGMVHQHFMLVDNFTVTQNIILGNETTSHLGVLNMKQAHKNVQDLVQKYGLEVDPDAKVGYFRWYAAACGNPESTVSGCRSADFGRTYGCTYAAGNGRFDRNYAQSGCRRKNNHYYYA